MLHLHSIVLAHVAGPDVISTQTLVQQTQPCRGNPYELPQSQKIREVGRIAEMCKRLHEERAHERVQVFPEAVMMTTTNPVAIQHAMILFFIAPSIVEPQDADRTNKTGEALAL